ncbi:uncharacterized protein LOC100907551 [Galendromus occidentalis]|uniref:Uncharacterized protein LOC100907551 n=1 Tax=Galendromus occidentalis TaxID=34638 RepID=A0AAJ7PB15_9ACAR|nr:uncharacterized protein LOC100907551 [Galendromus occidentalis]
MFGLIEAQKKRQPQKTQLPPEPRELVVKLDDGLCFDEFGRAVTSLLEDLLYRTSHIEQPVRRLDILREKLTPRNRAQFERLEKVLESIERLASSGTLAEVVLVQGSTISLAQYVTHIRLQAARWNDNTNRHQDALKLSKLNLFRAVASVDDILAPTNGPRSAKCFLFVKVVSQCSSEATSIEGFEIRPTLPPSRAKCRTIFNLCQSTEIPKDESGAETDNEQSDSPAGVWYQLAQNLPSVSISSS